MAELDPVIVKCLKDNKVTARNLLKHARLGTELNEQNIPNLVEKEKYALGMAAKRRVKNAEAMARMQQVFDRNLNTLGAKRTLKGTLVSDMGDATGMVGADKLADGYSQVVNRILDKAAAAFRPTITGGVRNSVLIEDAFKIMSGAKAQFEEARLLAQGMREAADLARKLYKDAGGDLGWIENWFPQNHNYRLMMKAGREDWKGFIRTKLDRAKMVDDAGEQLDDLQLEELLDYVFDAVTTQGASKAKRPNFNAYMFDAPISGRHALHRVLHFADPEDALAYHKQFGTGDLWGNFTASLRNLSTDTALMNVWGPDAYGNFSNALKYVEKAEPSFDLVGMDAMWKNIAGFDNQAENGWVNLAEGARNIASQAYMGSVVAASIPDTATMGLNMAMNDMNWTQAFRQFGKVVSEEEYQALARLSGDLDAYTSSLAATMRWEDPLGSGVTRRLSDANYRMNGMVAWMRKLNHTWTTEFLGDLASIRGKSFDQLSPGKQSFLKTYGLVDDWDTVRKAGTQTVRGRELIDLNTLDDIDLVARTLAALTTEREKAILVPDARVKAMLNMGHSSNTLPGQLLRSVTQFNSFAATMIVNGVMRYVMTNRLSTASKLRYGAAGVTSLTLLGAVSYQVKQLLNGKDPQEMNTADFWVRAASQGGAFPLIADMWLDGQTRHGRSAWELATGTAGSMASDTLGMPLRMINAAMKGEDVQEELGKGVERLTFYIPGSTSIWGRQMVQKLLRDSILTAVDPAYEARMNERARNIERRTGQEMFFPYEEDLGDRLTPDRMPEF